MSVTILLAARLSITCPVLSGFLQSSLITLTLRYQTSPLSWPLRKYV